MTTRSVSCAKGLLHLMTGSRGGWLCRAPFQAAKLTRGCHMALVYGLPPL